MTMIVAEGMNGEKYRMNGPYWVGRHSMKDTMGGVYIILASPQTQYRFDFVQAGESADLKDALCSIRSKRKWKNVTGSNYTYMAYLPTDIETKDMTDEEASSYRRCIADSIAMKYESDAMSSRQSVQETSNAMNA